MSSVIGLIVFMTVILVFIAIVIHILKKRLSSEEGYSEKGCKEVPSFQDVVKAIGGTWKTNGCQLHSIQLTHDDTIVTTKCALMGAKMPFVNLKDCETPALDFTPKTQMLACTVAKQQPVTVV